jgi:hypothetical protein
MEVKKIQEREEEARKGEWEMSVMIMGLYMIIVLQ